MSSDIANQSLELTPFFQFLLQLLEQVLHQEMFLSMNTSNPWLPWKENQTMSFQLLHSTLLMVESMEETVWLCNNSWFYLLELQVSLMLWELDLKYIIIWWKLSRRNMDSMQLMLEMREDLHQLLMMVCKLWSYLNLQLNQQVMRKSLKSEWTVLLLNFITKQLRNTIFTSKMRNSQSQFLT